MARLIGPQLLGMHWPVKLKPSPGDFIAKVLCKYIYCLSELTIIVLNKFFYVNDSNKV